MSQRMPFISPLLCWSFCWNCCVSVSAMMCFPMCVCWVSRWLSNKDFLWFWGTDTKTDVYNPCVMVTSCCHTSYVAVLRWQWCHLVYVWPHNPENRGKIAQSQAVTPYSLSCITKPCFVSLQKLFSALFDWL